MDVSRNLKNAIAKMKWLNLKEIWNFLKKFFNFFKNFFKRLVKRFYKIIVNSRIFFPELRRYLLGASLPLIIRGFYRSITNTKARKEVLSTSTSLWGIGFDAYLNKHFYNSDGSVRYDEYIQYYKTEKLSTFLKELTRKILEV